MPSAVEHVKRVIIAVELVNEYLERETYEINNCRCNKGANHMAKKVLPKPEATTGRDYWEKKQKEQMKAAAKMKAAKDNYDTALKEYLRV